MLRPWLVAALCLLPCAGCADMFGMDLSTPQVKRDAGGGGEPGDGDAGVPGGGADVLTVGPDAAADTGTADRPTSSGVNIAWMSNGTTSSFFNTSRNGAVSAGQALTSSSGVTVNVSIMDPSDNVAATQAQRIRDAVATGVNALAIDVIDPTVINPEIDKAVEAGVTVMTFDSDAPGSKRLSYYSMDNQASGATAAKILVSLMGSGGGDIAIMNKENPPTAANFVARRDGFTQELALHTGFKVVVDLPCTDGTTGESTLKKGCAGVLEDTMVAYPTVKGWFLSRGRPLRQTDLGADAPNWTAKIKAGAFFAVAYDAIPESLTSIKAGYVNAVINQKYWGWGYDVVTLLFNVVAKHRSVNVFTDSGFDVVCANNIDEVVQAWSLQSFSTPLSKCSLAGQQWP